MRQSVRERLFVRGRPSDRSTGIAFGRRYRATGATGEGRWDWSYTAGDECLAPPQFAEYRAPRSDSQRQMLETGAGAHRAGSILVRIGVCHIEPICRAGSSNDCRNRSTQFSR